MQKHVYVLRAPLLRAPLSGILFSFPNSRLVCSHECCTGCRPRILTSGQWSLLSPFEMHCCTGLYHLAKLRFRLLLQLVAADWIGRTLTWHRTSASEVLMVRAPAKPSKGQRLGGRLGRRSAMTSCLTQPASFNVDLQQEGRVRRQG